MSNSHSAACTLVIDQGTHATRCVLFDREGEELASFDQEIALRRDAEKVEQDAQEILESTKTTLRRALGYARARGLEPRAAGLATQRSTIVAWDRITGAPLAPALSWQDTRTLEQLRPLQAQAAEIQQRTGLRLSPHYAAPKLSWLLETDPRVAAARQSGKLALGPLASFLLFHLVQGRPFVLDHANAARTLLFDLRARQWDPWLLRLFGIQAEQLPNVLPIRHDYGPIVGTRIPLLAVTGDQNAAILSDGAPRPGASFANLGTGAFVLQAIGSEVLVRPPLLTGLIDSDDRDAQYALEGTVNGAGSALQWARDTHQWTVPDSELDETLIRCPDPPIFLNTVGGLGSPWWHSGTTPRWLDGTRPVVPDPRGGLAAIVESVVFLLSRNLSALDEAGYPSERIVLGGGLSRLEGLCQRLANLTETSVLRRRDSEATARGIAWLARGRPADWVPTPADRYDPRPDPRLHQRYRSFVASIEETLRT